MPRELIDTNNLEVVLHDPLTGEDTTLYYRAPTNSERIKFEVACVRGKGMKTKYSPAKAQLEFGAELLTGIKDGEFTANHKPLSSTPEAEGYREDWKDLVVKIAGDLIKGLAAHAFSIALVIKGGKDEDEDENEDEPQDTALGYVVEDDEEPNTPAKEDGSAVPLT